MEKRIECSVCGKEFDLKKDERYTGFEKGLLGGEHIMTATTARTAELNMRRR